MSPRQARSLVARHADALGAVGAQRADISGSVEGGLDSPVSDTGDLGCFGVVVSGIGMGLRVRWWSRHPLLTTLKTGGRRMDVRLPRLA